MNPRNLALMRELGNFAKLTEKDTSAHRRSVCLANNGLNTGPALTFSATESPPNRDGRKCCAMTERDHPTPLNLGSAVASLRDLKSLASI
jgi:hypothetical protein